MASVTKHPKSRFWTAYFSGRDGRQMKRSAKTTDRNAALEIALELERVERQAKAGALTTNQLRKVLNDVSEKVNGDTLATPPVEEYLSNWLKIIAARNSSATHERYRHAVELFVARLNGRAKKPMTSVTPQDIEDFLTWRLNTGVAPKTAAVDLKTLNTAFRRAEAFGTILKNPVAAKERLHAVILRRRDERFMATLMPLPASCGVLELAVIEGPGEELVNGAHTEGFAAHFARGPGAEGPLVVGDVADFGRGVETGEHQIPHTAEQWKAFRVLDQGVFAGLFVRVVQISDRRDTRIPAVLNLGFEAPLHVLAQVVHVFLGHAELDVHEDDVVILVRVTLRRRHDLDAVLFDGPDDRAAVHGVAGKTVQFPANDAGGFAPIQSLHHGIEHRTARLLGGFRF